jgi:hypothetical protein
MAEGDRRRRARHQAGRSRARAAAAANARAELADDGKLREVERALANKDLEAAQRAVATISPHTVAGKQARALVQKAEEAARAKPPVVVAQTKPSKPDKPSKPSKPEVKPPTRPEVKPPEVKPPEVKPPDDDEPVIKMSYDEAMMGARNALKHERYGEAFRLAKAALAQRGGDGDARMTATIAACGLNQRLKALVHLPNERSSYREVAISRCFKLGLNLE